MPPDGSSDLCDDWTLAAFGVDPRQRGLAAPPPKPKALKGADPNSRTSKAARDPKVWTQGVGATLTRQTADRPGARINPPPEYGPGTLCKGAGGKTVTVAMGKDGRVALTRDPPPIAEITFAGGGGKGAALPGAVRMLEESGVLKGVKEMHGASVGSLTAAVVAAGISADQFQKMSDDTDFLALIAGPGPFDIPFHKSGAGFENLIRTTMGSAIDGQIAAFKDKATKNGGKLDPKVAAVLDPLLKKLSEGNGPTFMDMRVLHKIIPEIKEVVISGTMVGTSGKPKPGDPPGPVKDVPPAMTVFSADTQPNMEVAQAVHASAAIPPVFSPVELTLKSGETAKFRDGGIMNNMPTGESLGLDRNIDPVPKSGSMDFIFQDDTTKGIMAGVAVPHRHALRDKFVDQDMSTQEYKTRIELADKPEDVVVVPLTFERKSGREADFTGNIKGTFNFNIDKPDRLKLQDMTKGATAKFLEEHQKQETRSFASMQQMLACTTRDDLVVMAQSKLPGAAEALAFRDQVTKQVKTLEHMAAAGAEPEDPKVRALLKAMTAEAAGDQERVAFTGRELNRSGKLDGMLAMAFKAGGPMPDALAAGVAVAQVVEARKTAQRILQQVIRPQMTVLDDPKSLEVKLLMQVDLQLRDARSNADINRALQMAIDEFKRKPTVLQVLEGETGSRAQFVDHLTRQMQPVH